jgi:hypothetical protein
LLNIYAEGVGNNFLKEKEVVNKKSDLLTEVSDVDNFLK